MEVLPPYVLASEQVRQSLRLDYMMPAQAAAVHSFWQAAASASLVLPKDDFLQLPTVDAIHAP